MKRIMLGALLPENREHARNGDFAEFCFPNKFHNMNHRYKQTLVKINTQGNGITF